MSHHSSRKLLFISALKTLAKKSQALFSIAALVIMAFSSIGLFQTQTVEAAGELSEKSPNYFYDRESAFIIKNTLDSVNGGMYLAVDKDGSLLNDPINLEVWGYGKNSVRGTDKTQVGQATCIRYFMNEYLRTTSNGVSGINEQLPADKKITSPTDLLLKAAGCADFAMEKMEIPADKQNSNRIPNALFYWGAVSKDGSIQIDDTNEVNTEETFRTESSLSWTLAELALMMKKYGVAGEQKYVDGAMRWWNWRKDKAVTLNDNFDTGLEAGAGRDLYYPALGWTLTQLTGNAAYRDGTGKINDDGTPQGAIPFANAMLGTGNKPTIPFNEPNNALQEKSYAATWARGFLYAKHQNEFNSQEEARDQWQDFGWHSLIRGDYPDYFVTAPANITAADLSQPFLHGKGRELTAGLIKSAWWFGSYGTNPNMFYIADNSDPSSLSQGDFLNATKSMWDLNNEKLWDNTSGQAAWLEAVGQPFKPCFSGDNDVPFVDWKAPKIGDKVHSVNTDRSATVTVSGVEDEDVPFMSVALLGSGVKNVDVTYSIDNGATWIVIPATFNGTNYTATIPAVSAGTKVYYYARAKDFFNNQTVFPAGSEVFNTSNEVLSRDKAKAQNYTIPGGAVTTPNETPTLPTTPTTPTVPTTPVSPTVPVVVTPTTPVKPVETTTGGTVTDPAATPTIKPVVKSDAAATPSPASGQGAGGTGELIRTGGYGPGK
jgi:hypothetical protein